jgi:multidrug efflux pump subunit AcrA (membrane-fusion protein)
MTETPLPTTTRRHELDVGGIPARRLRPWPNYILGVAVVGAIVAAVLLVGPAATSSSTQYRYVTVERGVVQASESASGNLAPINESDLNFKSSGILTGLYVSAGQHVHAGQLLAQIDPTSAQVALEEAQANLEAAQAKLAETEANPSGSSSSSPSTPTESRLARATDTYGATGASGATAPAPTGATGDSVGASGDSGASGTTKTKSPSSKKKSSSSTTQSSSDSAVTAATDQANIASAQAAVSSDELTVKTDQTALDGTKLYAPTAGTIASVSGAVGDEVTAGSGSSSADASDSGSGSSGSALGGAASSSAAASSSDSSSSSSGSGFIVLADLSSMQLVVSVSEADIGTIKAGEPATVSVNALPSEEFAAKVTSISVLSTDTSGVVSYDVTLQLTQNSSQLRPGMSATATIISKQVNDAINVESAAISSRGTTSTVLLVKNGKTVETPVITGLVGTSSTQVVAGVQPGDEVAIAVASSIATATGTSSSSSTGSLGGGLGGGGFGGGGLGRFARGG